MKGIIVCSIYGAFGKGTDIDPAILSMIRNAARDRGRDGGRIERYDFDHDFVGYLGNWRATPTTEREAAPLQPYGGIVHNGTIANDRELGNPEGAVDSMILPEVLDLSDVGALAASLGKVRGSYAIAARGHTSIMLAANYKPVYYATIGGATYFASVARHFHDALPFGHAPVKLKPYTALDLRTGQSVALAREDIKRALVIASAGLDSTVAATKMLRDGWEVTLLHFTYGCNAEGREVEAIRQIASALGVPLVFMPIDYRLFAGGSPLLSGDAPVQPGVPGAEFAHEWVPARNLLMMALATAYAEANGFGAIVLGNNLEESGAYPDNEEEFTTLLDAALDYAVHDGAQVRVVAPVGNLMKHEIVRLGLDMGAPLGLTWSCYRGGERHCGECGPCFMRRTAFERNGAADPVFEAGA